MQSDSVLILTDRVEKLACHACGGRIDVTQVMPFTSVECPHCHVQTPVPARLGNFLLFKQLGSGAMGAVYQAFDTSLKRHVAIKVLLQSLGRDPKFVQQFMAEARALAALNHPNICQIYSCGTEKQQPYIVMELVSGGRLDKTMAKSGSLEEMAVLRLGLEVAEGLRAAHKAGLTHGDIKPENILFSKSGAAKVVDFGLASFAGAGKAASEIWGTPYYIAPEKLKGQAGDHRSDIYSLGATLFHLLTGKPPFDAATAQQTALARLERPAPDVRELKPSVHPATAALLARTLEMEQASRYPNYDSLLADLRRALSGLEEAAKQKPGKRVERNFAAWIPAVLGAVVLVAAGVFYLKPKPRPSRIETPSPRPGLAVVSNRQASASVSTPPLAAPSPSAAPRRMPSLLTRQSADVILSVGDAGADAFIQGKGGSRDLSDKSHGAEKVIWVKSAADDALHLARKAYVLIDAPALGSYRIADAALVLTAAAGGKNAEQKGYTLKLWGLPDVRWHDGKEPAAITWNTAPANDTGRGDRLAAEATLLISKEVSANLAPGSTLVFENSESAQPDGFVRFLASRASSGFVGFAITADLEPEQRAGWKFVSREAGAKQAPVLLLKVAH